MNTTRMVKTADKVKAAIERGYKKKALAEQIGIARTTFDNRLKDNSWLDAELSKLQNLGII
jgi:DNA-binding Xre family transcriptional regulator